MVGPANKRDQDKHWLLRQKTIRNLWIGTSIVLLATVIGGLFVPLPGHFKWDGYFWFFAVYGFATCAVMVFVAKALGYILKRPDNYYDD